jgi:hypothetical protein
MLCRRHLWPALALALAVPAGPGSAQSVTTSAGPQSVSVTIYRDPGRTGEAVMNLRWLNGFALVTETRQVTIPAGEADIRFEGVAGGIIPESAIVTGLPDGVVEKNQDAYLLSPASLLDRSLGKRILLRRTSRATGEVTEQDAIVRSGRGGAVILQTAEGYEALRCTGLPEAIVYDEVPAGLSAKPTLSVRTRSRRAVTATISLSYLATGFDWQANYVATLAPSGDRVDLFAWVTLANGDETSFVNASTQTVAGRLHREQSQSRPERAYGGVALQCWPSGTTSDLDELEDEEAYDGVPPPPPPPPPMAPAPILLEASASRAKMVQQEELGDLKLYRVPEPVTVASNSQKQVALLDRSGVKVETLYRTTINSWADEEILRPIRILKTRNRKEEGLGLPLPAGGVVLFGKGYSRPVLLGEGSVDDKAVGEDVEIKLSEATGVIAHVLRTSGSNGSGDYRLTVTNDQAQPIRFEAEFGNRSEELFPSGKTRIGRRNGRPSWSVTVPANGSVSMSYRIARKS